MIIGILQADSVLEKFQADHGNYPLMFEQVLGAASASVEFKHYDVEHGEYPDNIDDCDGYVITGSKKSVYDDEDWIHVLQDFVAELHKSKKKTVGICFGHQLIAQALGGKTEPADLGWNVGVHQNEVLSSEAFMAPAVDSFGLIVSHKDQVTQLPAGAELLATSEFCPNASFKIGEHILTFQGHPEFSKAYSQDLMIMRQDILGDKYEPGIASLVHGHDNKLIGTWIVNFIRAR